MTEGETVVLDGRGFKMLSFHAYLHGIATMPLSQLPFLAFLSGAAALDKDPALCDDASERWTTYGDLRERIPKLSSFWHQKKRGLILCAVPRTVNGAVAFLGACASGHVVFPIDPGLVRLEPFINAYDPEWIISASAIKPNEAYDSVEWGLGTLYLWQRVATGESVIHPDLFLLLLPANPEESSRTVRLSYKNIASNVQASREALDVKAKDRALLHLPLAFTLGFSVITTLLAAGGSLILSEEDVKSRAFWDLARHREASLFPGTSFHYDFLSRAGLDNLRAPRLQTFWLAGGRTPPERLRELLKQITQRKGKFFILFGQAEASPRLSVLAAHDFPEKTGSVGQALPGGTFRTENDRILYAGPNVMMGYAQDKADLSRGDEMAGRLVLDEQGFLDPEGFLHLVR